MLYKSETMKILTPLYDNKLIKSATKGDLKGVKEAILRGADINARTKDGQTAWMVAYSHYYAEIVKFLESKGAIITELDQLNAGISARLNKACALPKIDGHKAMHHMVHGHRHMARS